MIYINDIVRQLYPSVETVVLNGDDYKGFDKDGVAVSINKSAIDAEYVKQDYKNKRKYPSIQDQLDMQYWDKENGTTTWVDAVAKVKSDNPKP